jgi:glycosyltransferase involved in cell wall biosynthesis
MNTLAEAGQHFANSVKQHEVSKMMAQAVGDHQAGNLEKAAEAYQHILAVDNRNVMALNNLSLMLDPKAALGFLQAALEVDPNYVDALINSCIRCHELGHPIQAIDHLLRLKELAPQDDRVKNLSQLLVTSQAENLDKVPTDSEAIQLVPPLFSVIIPTHKRAHLLARALSSIAKQTLAGHHEIIVISDCPDEATDKVCRQWLENTDTYICRSGVAGPAQSRNIGIQMARGEVVLFLDDDDAWHPNLLASLKDSEDLRQGYPVYFNLTVVKESRLPDVAQKHSETLFNTAGLLTEEIFVKNQISNSCIAIPRILLADLRFDPHMRAYEDWDFLLSLLERRMPKHLDILGPQIHEVDDETSDRRGSNKAANDLNAVMDYLYVYRRHPVNSELQQKRSILLSSVGLNLPPDLL